jgi:hypothetical protein
MNRRLFLQVPSTVVAMPLAQAAAPKVIGILNAYHPSDVRESLDLFDRAMLALGYAKGTHYVTIERMARETLIYCSSRHDTCMGR